MQKTFAACHGGDTCFDTSRKLAQCLLVFAASPITVVIHSKIKHKGSDFFIFDSSENTQTRFGRSGFYTGSSSWYHDAVIDKKGSIYMGDILGNTLQQFERTTTLQIP